MGLKSFFNDLANNYTKKKKKQKQKLEFSPAQQEKFKRDIVEDIFKNKNSMKTTELENILKSYVSPDKIERFREIVKNENTITKEEFFQLLQNNAL